MQKKGIVVRGFPIVPTIPDNVSPGDVITAGHTNAVNQCLADLWTDLQTVGGAEGQTPWLTDIDAAGHDLNNAGNIGAKQQYLYGDSSAPAIQGYYYGGVARWLVLAAGAESGSNSGSNFEVARFSDAGALQDIALTIARATGNIGIATASPQAQLDLSGTVNGDTPGANLKLCFSAGATPLFGFRLDSGNGSLILDRAYGAWATPAAIKVIRSNGFVGINQDNPQVQLDVTGNINATGGNYYLGLVPVLTRTGAWVSLYSQIGGGLSVVNGAGTATLLAVSDAGKLTVNGMIQSTANGFQFPDGTVQVTAATGGGGPGMSQTPWVSDIDGGGHDLSNVYTVNAAILSAGNRVEASGAAADPATNADKGIVKITGTTTAQLQIGTQAGAPYGMWLQTKDSQNTGAAYPLLLNPVGAPVGINTGNPLFALDVNGDVNISGRYLVNGVPISTGSGGAPQTPWASDIDAAGHDLNAVKIVRATNNVQVTTGSDVAAINSTSVLWLTGSNRWAMTKTGAETGSNAGSDFVLTRYSDAGASIGTPLTILRASGNTGLGVTAPAYRLDISGDCNITGVYRVNGTPISTGGAAPNFADGIVPAGTLDGTNAAFTLPNAPAPALSLKLFVNGVLQRAVDFALATATITFTTPPRPNDAIRAWFRY